MYEYCRTFDPHDDSMEFQAKSFPRREYFGDLFKYFEQEYAKQGCGVVAVPKSRQMMVSWGVCAYLLWRAWGRTAQELLIQSKKEDDATYQLERVKFMYRNLPQELKDYSSLKKKMESQAKTVLEFENMSNVVAVPEGGAVVRSHVPAVLFQDEAQEQTESEESYGAAIPCCKLIILVGTPAPGFFQRIVEDADGGVDEIEEAV